MPVANICLSNRYMIKWLDVNNQSEGLTRQNGNRRTNEKRDMISGNQSERLLGSRQHEETGRKQTRVFRL